MSLADLLAEGLPWAELKAKLLEYPYRSLDRDRHVATKGGTREARTDAMTYHESETWDEVRRARNFGMITNDQYLELARDIAKKPTVAAAFPLELGEGGGHPFRGNQWTQGESGGEKLPPLDDQLREARVPLTPRQCTKQRVNPRSTHPK